MDIETLQQTNKQLIETLDELNKIRADGKAKRANAEQELGRIEGELRQRCWRSTTDCRCRGRCLHPPLQHNIGICYAA